MQALSTLRLLPSTTDQVKRFVDLVKDEIRSGSDREKLEAHILLKFVTDTIKAINDDPEIRESILKAAAMYPEKTFTFGDFIITKTTRSTYDYTACGDSQWETLDSQIKGLTDRRKEREKYLQAIRYGDSVINGDTGEVLFPPASRTTEFLTIKKL